MQQILRIVLLTLAIRKCGFALAMSLVPAEIPYDEIPFEIYESSSTSFEDTVMEKIDKATNGVKAITDLTKVGSIIPYLDTVMGPISDGLDYLQSNIWEETLIKSIADASRRLAIGNEYTNLRSGIISVSQGLQGMKNSIESLEPADKSFQVQIWYEKLKDFSNRFIQRTSIFRSYPEFAYVPLTLLASITAVLDPIFTEFAPKIAENSFMTCQLRDNMIEFRNLLVWKRLGSLKVRDLGVKGKNNIDKKLLNPIKLRAYERYGYNSTNKGAIDCNRGCGRYNGIACLHDPVAGLKYSAFAVNHDPENCVAGYAGLLRHRIEKAYRDSIELMDSTCNQDVMNRRRLTEYGYWSVNVIGMEGITKRNSKTACDPDIFSNGPFTYCDPYTRIYINGNLVFTSSEASNENEHYTDEEFVSAKIREDSTVRFELMDADAGQDEVILQVDKTINELKDFRGQLQEGRNFIVLSTFWRRSYEDDGLIS